MTVTVLDSNNLEAVIADAQLEQGAPRLEAKAEPEKKVEQQAEGEKKIEQADDDEIEDENGLTASQRAELTQKMQKAIGKKHREKKEAEEFAAAQYNERRLAEQRAADLERQLNEAKPKAQEKAPETERPARQNFETDDAYIEALAGWKADQKLAEKQAADAQAAAERRQQEIADAAKARLKRAAELVPDFEEVFNDMEIGVPNVVAGYMQRSEMFAEIGYYFAKNPDVLLSLSKLDPADQLVTVGKIEGRLKPFGKEAKPNEEPKDAEKASDAPNGKKPSDLTGFSPSSSKARRDAPVIKPLKSEGAAVEPDPSDMDIRETISSWQKSNKINLGLRKRH